jgi:DNA-binding NarL/FixJ family response regulator
MSGRRVVVADDDVLMREGIAGLLERSGFEIAGQAGDAADLLRLVRDQEPDLVIVDIRMPPSHETEGLDAARVIRRELPEVGILVLSAHAEVDEAMELLATGRGIGYVLKSRVSKVEDLIETVDRVIDGGSVVDPAIVEELVQVRHREDRLERLTQREREVLELMAEGA